MDSMQVSNKINQNTMVTTATTTPHHNQAPHTLHHKYEVVYLAMEMRSFSSTHSEQVTMTTMIRHMKAKQSCQILNPTNQTPTQQKRHENRRKSKTSRPSESGDSQSLRYEWI